MYKRGGHMTRMNSFYQRQKNVILSFRLGWIQFFKYQIITKIVFGFLLIPLFLGIIHGLMYIRGIVVIGNTQMRGFFMSIPGMIAILSGAVLLFLALIIELGGLVVISNQVWSNSEEVGFFSILKNNITSFPKFINVGGLVIILYLVVLVPLSGSGVTVSLLKDIKIPNFIMSSIESSAGLLLIYVGIIFLMTILAAGMIFVFPYVFLLKKKATNAISLSFRLVLKQWKRMIIDFVSLSLLMLVLTTSILFIWFLITAGMAWMMPKDHMISRSVLLFLMLIQRMGVVVATMLYVPFVIHQIVFIFREVETVSLVMDKKKKVNFIDRLFINRKRMMGLVIVSAMVMSIPMGIFFHEIFAPKDILIIGHRGGGGKSVPENSLPSIEVSIQNKADFVEIDIQRTKDGSYVVFHDPTLFRMAGIRKKITEMTLEEIKDVDIGQYYPGYEGTKIPTLEEVLQSCRGKIGVFLECKSPTADTMMVDDIVALIEKYKMREDVLFMSLDYSLVKYVRSKYPAYDTGFTYVLSLGNPGRFQASHLILEETAATDKNLDKIHFYRKYAVVWTVNTDESMEQFIEKEVDGIITDEVEQLMKKIEERKKLSDFEIVIKMIS